MTEKEQKKCILTADILSSLSRLGYGLFLSIPFFLICFFKEPTNSIVLVVSVTGIISGIFLGIRAWHLYFDSCLLKSLVLTGQNPEGLDSVFLFLFNKKMNNKNLEERLKGCSRLAKNFVYGIGIQIILLITEIGVLVYRFIFLQV